MPHDGAPIESPQDGVQRASRLGNMSPCGEGGALELTGSPPSPARLRVAVPQPLPAGALDAAVCVRGTGRAVPGKGPAGTEQRPVSQRVPHCVPRPAEWG